MTTEYTTLAETEYHGHKIETVKGTTAAKAAEPYEYTYKDGHTVSGEHAAEPERNWYEIRLDGRTYQGWSNRGEFSEVSEATIAKLVAKARKAVDQDEVDAELLPTLRPLARNLSEGEHGSGQKPGTWAEATPATAHQGQVAAIYAMGQYRVGRVEKVTPKVVYVAYVTTASVDSGRVFHKSGTAGRVVLRPESKIEADKAESSSTPEATATGPTNDREVTMTESTTEAPAPAEAPKTVTYSVNGKARVVRTSPRPYTLSYLAGEVIGGGGATKILRDLLAKAGVTDPEHTEWEHTLDNGKVIGASFTAPGAQVPAKARKATPAHKAPAKAKAPALDTLKAASEKLRKAGRYEGDRKVTLTKANAADIAGMTLKAIKALPVEETQPDVTPQPKGNTTRAKRASRSKAPVARNRKAQEEAAKAS